MRAILFAFAFMTGIGLLGLCLYVIVGLCTGPLTLVTLPLLMLFVGITGMSAVFWAGLLRYILTEEEL